jgi:hypothetical protein
MQHGLNFDAKYASYSIFKREWWAYAKTCDRQTAHRGESPNRVGIRAIAPLILV